MTWSKQACLAIDQRCEARRVGNLWTVINGAGETIAGPRSSARAAWRQAYAFIRNRQENPREAP